MPPRLSKRQQRELEELEALGGPSHEAAVSSDEEQANPVAQNRAGAGFAALFSPQEDDQESENEASLRATKHRKSKKKKKKATELPAVQTSVSLESPPRSSSVLSNASSQAKVSKKAMKKARAREKKAGDDEVEQALAELSIKYPELQNLSMATRGASASTSSSHSLAALLSVSLPDLDSEAEMRKFFGSRVVQANKATSSGPSEAYARRQAGTLRSHLTRPQPTWWAEKQREGLSIRSFTEEELQEKLRRQRWDQIDDGEKWWTVEYGKKYKSMTMSFMRTVMSGDPEGFWELLGKLPWHADTLLQLSEVFRHREEYGQAVDFVDRALFTYERSFIGAFTFTTGLNRLDFDHVENRPFFLAIHRKLTDLQRRGCVRTAFEFARLLYSLDPWNDPHGALLHLDYLALKAGLTQWLLELFDLFTDRRGKLGEKQDTRMDPSLLPGWSYARALALRITEGTQKKQSYERSTAALKEAITSFPSVVPLLADKLDITLPVAIRSHRDFKLETDASQMSAPTAALHLLSHLYVLRSFSLWKDPLYTTWFASTVMEEFSFLPPVLPTTVRRDQFLHLYQQPGLQHSAYRHITVLESSYRKLFSFIPHNVLSGLACDPLPPPTAVTEYDRAFFAGTEEIFSMTYRTRQQRAADERRLERVIPDAAFRQQLQALFEAHPNLAERFPGGILQFVQMAGQMPEDILEDLMLIAAMADERRMPGEPPGLADLMVDPVDELRDATLGREQGRHNLVPPGPEDNQGENVDEDEDEDEDESEDEDVPPMPVRVLRNLIGRFWGGNTVSEDSSEDERTISPVDDDGVD